MKAQKIRKLVQGRTKNGTPKRHERKKRSYRNGGDDIMLTSEEKRNVRPKNDESIQLTNKRTNTQTQTNLLSP
jgi:hypothetical protein